MPINVCADVNVCDLHVVECVWFVCRHACDLCADRSMCGLHTHMSVCVCVCADKNVYDLCVCRYVQVFIHVNVCGICVQI